MGEGGGQVLRNSLALSCLTGRTVEVCNVRAGRRKPGLRPQHLAGVRALAEIVSARVEGDEVGSRRVVFRPGSAPRAGDYLFDVARRRSSAGSVTLLFQALHLPLSFAPGPSRLTLGGGTHVAWSPPADYLSRVYLPTVREMGVSAEVETTTFGFYPRGGGEARAKVSPSRPPLAPLTLLERGPPVGAEIISAVCDLPLSIAERQMNSALDTLGGGRPLPSPRTRCVEVPGPAPGTYVFILIEHENVRSGFSSLGARGRRAEEVGRDAAAGAVEYMNGPGTVDPHLADQLVLPAALASGTTTYNTPAETPHLAAALDIIAEFLPVRTWLEPGPGGSVTVAIEGAGFAPQ